MTLAAALGSGLIAGVFFAFSTFVMKALARLPALHGIAAMQSINVTVLNPWFMTAFLGTASLCVILLISSVLRWPEPGSGLGVAGSLLYLIGSFLVTIVCNVPRNEALARVQPADADGTDRWAGYLAGWTAWNHVRTVAALAAAAAFIMGLWV
jgi:uncharacterized membrane protein